MYDYDIEKMRSVLGGIIAQTVPAEAWNWLQEKTTTVYEPSQMNLSFSLLPRKVGKSPIVVDEAQQKQIEAIRAGFSIHEFTADRLGRVWLLLHADAANEEKYYKLIQNLFQCAEVNELVALYSALPMLAWPARWVKQCAEGIRSNMGSVLEAIMYHNPYPAAHLDQPAWNQLVLKAIFTGKELDRIVGLNNRTNQELAQCLVDYAKERYAAGRSVDPQLKRLAKGFIDETQFPQDLALQ